MMELVYDKSAVPHIEKRFPHVKVEDASDFIHEDRVEITLPDEDRDAFYKHAIVEGYSEVCLGFGIQMRDTEGQKEIRRWLDELKAEKDASTGDKK